MPRSLDNDIALRAEGIWAARARKVGSGYSPNVQTGDEFYSGGGNKSRYYLAARPLPLDNSSTPGWQWVPGVNTAQVDGTDKVGLSVTGSAFHATTAGTLGYHCLKSEIATGSGIAGPMAFVSARCLVSALPEATRTLRFGQLWSDGTIYGYCVTLNSDGTYQIDQRDDYAGSAVLASGGSGFTAGQRLYFERFGHHLYVGRIPSGSNTPTGILEAILPTNGAYAAIFARAGLGFTTDANSVRVSDLSWVG